MSTRVLEALPGKRFIKRHSLSILYVLPYNVASVSDITLCFKIEEPLVVNFVTLRYMSIVVHIKTQSKRFTPQIGIMLCDKKNSHASVLMNL